MTLCQIPPCVRVRPNIPSHSQTLVCTSLSMNPPILMKRRSLDTWVYRSRTWKSIVRLHYSAIRLQAIPYRTTERTNWTSRQTNDNQYIDGWVDTFRIRNAYLRTLHRRYIRAQFVDILCLSYNGGNAYRRIRNWGSSWANGIGYIWIKPVKLEN